MVGVICDLCVVFVQRELNETFRKYGKLMLPPMVKKGFAFIQVRFLVIQHKSSTRRRILVVCIFRSEN